MNAPELLAALEGGRIPAVSLFFGDERWFGEEAVRVVRREFLGEDAEGYLSLRAPRSDNDREGTPLVAAVEEGRTVPMFGGRQVVAWRGRKLEAEEVAVLEDLAGASPAFVRFVIVLDGLAPAASKKLEKAGAGLGQARKLFDTPWPGKPEHDTPLNKWACERARRRTLRLDLRTAHLLTGAIGNDLAAIDGTLERLLLQVGANAVVTEEHLAPLLGIGRDFDVFAFGDAIYRRDAAQAFRVCRNAFREGLVDKGGRRIRDAGQVAGRLLWSAGFQLDRVYEAARLLGEGGSVPEVERAIGGGRTNPVMKRAVQMAGLFTVEALREHYVLLARGESQVRSNLPAPAVVEALIPRLTGAVDE